MTETLTVPAGEKRLVTTDELMAMLARGEQVYLPAVQAPDEDVLAQYSAQDRARLAVSAADNPIVSVEYVRDEEVQCISVADERHLYITNDFMPTHNTSNIVFLKSTDDSMMDTLTKMSGIKHKAYTDSKTVTKDVERLMMQTEGKVSYTMSVKEEAVITFNDLMFISERNSIVFRAGDSPVWNRNETILPMSWRLFKDTIQHAGHEYSLQTIPTLSSALDFDVRLNQPDFVQMLAKRMAQAVNAPKAKEVYQTSYDYTDYDIERLDPDVYSDEVMGLIGAMTWEKNGLDPENLEEVDADAQEFMFDNSMIEENTEVIQETARRQEKRDGMGQKIYAGQQISRDMLINPDGTALSKTLDVEIVGAYRSARPQMVADTEHFRAGDNGSLYSRDGSAVYISKLDESDALREAQSSAEDQNGRVFSEGNVMENVEAEFGSAITFKVHGAFYEYLASLDTWQGLANGDFDREMKLQMLAKDNA